jgi:hypothetical protein
MQISAEPWLKALDNTTGGAHPIQPLPSRARQMLHIPLTVVALLLAVVLSASARAPIFDESRGVLAVAPMLEQTRPPWSILR